LFDAYTPPLKTHILVLGWKQGILGRRRIDTIKVLYRPLKKLMDKIFAQTRILVRPEDGLLDFIDRCARVAVGAIALNELQSFLLQNRGQIHLASPVIYPQGNHPLRPRRPVKIQAPSLSVVVKQGKRDPFDNGGILGPQLQMVEL
jgi:hypothetical protein